jgi:hypothetical protein
VLQEALRVLAPVPVQALEAGRCTARRSKIGQRAQIAMLTRIAHDDNALGDISEVWAETWCSDSVWRTRSRIGRTEVYVQFFVLEASFAARDYRADIIRHDPERSRGWEGVFLISATCTVQVQPEEQARRRHRPCLARPPRPAAAVRIACCLSHWLRSRPFISSTNSGTRPR